MKITSLANPLIKDVLKLYKNSFRKESNLFILEGKREVSRLSKDFTIKKVFTTEASTLDAPTYLVHQKVFNKISMRGEREGILVIAEKKHHTVTSFFHTLPDDPKILVLDGLEKPGNVGAILRSACAFAMDGVILSDCSIDLYHPNVLRSSISCVQSIPILTTSNSSIIPLLKEKNIAIIASTLQEGICLSQTVFPEKYALVLGSEDKGVNPLWKQASSKKVFITMNQSAVDSLNVSVAAALFCYEICRRKTHPL